MCIRSWQRHRRCTHQDSLLTSLPHRMDACDISFKFAGDLLPDTLRNFAFYFTDVSHGVAAALHAKLSIAKSMHAW